MATYVWLHTTQGLENNSQEQQKKLNTKPIAE
jgi:hypothetical protein